MRLIDKDKLLWRKIKISYTLKNGDFVVGHYVPEEYIALAKEIDAVPVDTLLHMFGGEAPCNFNGWDEYADCEYCEKHCDEHDVLECWKNAIREGWFEK